MGRQQDIFQPKPVQAVDENLFELVWVEAFCRRWNESGPNKQPFSSIGAVKFEVTRSPGVVSTALFWDENGFVSIWTGATAGVPCFTGTPQAWAELINGERTAVASVLRKALIYRGPIAFAILNGHKFDRVAEVSRQVAHPLTPIGERK